MAKFYTARQQGGYVPVVMELPEHIVIEGIPHNKQTLNPLFLKSLEYNNTDNLCSLLFNRMWLKHTLNGLDTHIRNYLCDPSFVKNDGGLGVAKYIWESEVSAGEIYVVGPASRTRVLRIIGSDLSIANNLSGTYGIDNGSNQGLWATTQAVHNACIFNERTGSFDVLIHFDHSYNSCSYTPWVGYGSNTRNSDTFEGMMIGKATWTFSGTNYLPTVPTTSAQIVQQSEVLTFIALSGQGVYAWNGYLSSGAPNYLDMSTGTIGYYGRHRLIRNNRSTFGDNTVLFDITGDTYFATPAPTYSRLREGTPNTHDYWVTLPTSTANFFKIYRCSFNIDTGASGVTQLATIDFAGTDFTLNVTHKGLTVLSQQSRSIYLRNYLIHTSTGTDFLGLTLCETSASSTEPVATFGTYIFSIDLSNQSSPRLVPIQVIMHDQKPREIFPMDADFRKIMIITDTYIAFMVFDEVQNEYNEVNRYNVAANAVAMDELDRVWVSDTSGRIFLLSPFVPTKVTVDWELANYDYTGTNISTYINVSAYDAFGSRIAVNVTLTIDSLNCSFADSTKVKTVATSDTTETQVSVLLTGSGYVRVLANTAL
jgi:hypothetical protein